jgi:hypothetical protein
MFHIHVCMTAILLHSRFHLKAVDHGVTNGTDGTLARITTKRVVLITVDSLFISPRVLQAAAYDVEAGVRPTD